MLICYLDESGDTATVPTSTSNIQPLICIVGISIASSKIIALTNDFVDLKRKFFPKKVVKATTKLGAILVEIKGSDLRANLRSSSRDVRRHTIGFLDHVFALLEAVEARIFGRVWIKAIGAKNNDASIYTFSVQHICQSFQSLLRERSSEGIVIADSRTNKQNAIASFSIFTQKFQILGDAYPHLAEMPTFGHSENHAGLQLADFMASAILYPLSAFAYCSGKIENVHVQKCYEVLRLRYGTRLQKLQYRYSKTIQPTPAPATPMMDGGLVVSDPLGLKGTHLLFRP